MEKHEEPFHVFMGCGHQLYCDGVIHEPGFQELVHTAKQDRRRGYPLTDEIFFGFDGFYSNHYC